jgi:hypothetical protein
VIHESAHGIASLLCQRRLGSEEFRYHPGHGTIFVRVFVELLRHYGHNEFQLLSSLEEWGIKWSEDAACEPARREK